MRAVWILIFFAAFAACGKQQAAEPRFEMREASQKTMQQDFVHILNDWMPFVRSEMSGRQLVPFGVIRKSDGSGELVNYTFARKEPFNPEVTDFINGLQRSFAAKVADPEIVATAIFYPGVGTPPGKTQEIKVIAVALDHREGNSIEFLIGYYREGDQIMLRDDRWYTDGEQVIFPKPDASAVL